MLKCKTAVPLIDIYIEATAMQRASTVQNHPVEKEIHQTLDRIYGIRAPQRGTVPKFISQETLRLWAKEKEQETQELL